MDTVKLLNEQIRVSNTTFKKLCDTLGCDEKTLRNYLNGATTSGPYLTLLLQELHISLEKWNNCTNIRRGE